LLIFFQSIVRYPKQILFLCLVLCLIMATGLFDLTRDTSADSFLSTDHPALVHKKKVKALFGLTDPLVVAIYHNDSVFNTEVLQLISDLTQRLQDHALIDSARVTSLQTLPFFKQEFSVSMVEQQAKLLHFYQGMLYSSDKKMTLISAEMDDEQQAAQIYLDVLEQVRQMDKPEGVEIYVAGEGAFSGYLGEYVDQDAKKMNPIAGFIMVLILFIAYRTLRATILPYVVVLSTLIFALGLMSFVDIPFFVTTNGLLAILLGIAVADAIHIFNQYYELMALHPQWDAKQVVVHTMLKMGQPITLTSLTTISGFMGLYWSSDMPPFRYLGLFAAIGVAAAWFYSICFLPACLALLELKPSPSYRVAGTASDRAHLDFFGVVMAKMGEKVLLNYRFIIAASMLCVVLGIIGVTQVRVNDSRLGILKADSPLYAADAKINQHMGGSSTLDIVFETSEKQGLLRPDRIEHIAQLQDYILSLDYMGSAFSYINYLKQGTESLDLKWTANEQATQQFLEQLAEQKFPIRQAMNADQTRANMRIQVNYIDYATVHPILQDIQSYIDRELSDLGMQVTMTGQVYVHNQWVSAIGASHFYSIVVTLCLVGFISMMLFRSVLAGFLVLCPVVVSILIIYALMGLMDIALGIGTSMFASVAIGLGVDFSIHTLVRIQHLCAERETAQSFDTVLKPLFTSTGRALLFNFLTIGLGFAALLLSEVTPLNHFGGIVFLAVGISFFTSIAVLPALIKWIQPQFVHHLKLEP